MEEGGDGGTAGSAGSGGMAGSGGSAGTGGMAGSGGTTGECTPGESFPSDDGCNTCECPESGLIAEAPCTERECPDRCEPGTFFDLDCNTCECPESGLREEAACTELACPGPCEGLPCGADCSPERPELDGDEDPGLVAPARSVCTNDGRCVPENEAEMCVQPHPCDGLACGESCSPVSQRQPGNDPDNGNEPNVPQRNYICDGQFDCVPVDEAPELDCAAARCEDRVCGEVCGPVRRPSSGNNEADRALPEEPAEAELCNADGECVNVIDPIALMCEEPLLRPDPATI